MRVPVTPKLSTKDGSSNSNARLTNTLKETSKTGDKAVIRPGLVVSTTYSGLGNGLVEFDGRLLNIVDDTVYLEQYTWMQLDVDEWNVSTTYNAGDFIWYNGFLFVSVSGGSGNTPAIGSVHWKTVYEIPDYDAGDTYAIGDPVVYNGTVYYSWSASNSNLAPDTYTNVWQTSAPGSSRYHGTGGMSAAPNWPGYTDLTGIESASALAAAEAWLQGLFALLPTSCPESTNGEWTTGEWRLSGLSIEIVFYAKSSGRACGDPGNGPTWYSPATVVQTV